MSPRRPSDSRAASRAAPRTEPRTEKGGRAGLVAGRFATNVHPALDAINRSLGDDLRLWPQDVRGSVAHARMLGERGILPEAAVARIVQGLARVAQELERGTFEVRPQDEDVHMAVERRLTELIGEDGKRLHTARSRNDQVATDLRLHLLEAGPRLAARVEGVQRRLVALAHAHGRAVMPFYTHLQRAQPVLFGHVLLAYVEMLGQDRADLLRAPVECPLGAGAGTGTSFPIDRRATARALGFARPSPNSLEAVSSRRDVTMFACALAACATTLSRLGADLVLWSTSEFGFVRLGDAVTTGSSIMPHKRNPDGAELLRAKAARVVSAAARLFELQRGLPIGYHKDLQEDKPALFDAQDTLEAMLAVADAMLADVRVDEAAMRAAVEDGGRFLLATELADALVRRGVAFREAHEVVGRLVSEAERRGVALDELPAQVFEQAHPLADARTRRALSIDAALAARRALGGTAPSAFARELARWSRRLAPRGRAGAGRARGR